ncbi:MAG: LPS export ABC transporter permease LptG [Gammaproteobacteria bacterium]|nr:LPS export ABC transporter permease LptG [Gammaproteobacteria bacterium]
MTLLDRYLARTVLFHTLMVMAVLMALMTLVTFIGQQDDIGTGSYSVGDAFLFTILTLPQQCYELLPIATLIAAILGLGALARDSELTVLRAAGVPIVRIAASAALAGLIVAALMWFLGEYFAPPADRYARQHKIFSKFSQVDIAGNSSAWVRQGSWFLNVRQQAADNLYGGVFVYELDADHRLRLAGHAETASQDPAGRWVLLHYGETRLDSTRVESRISDREEPGTQFNVDFLGLAVTKPLALPLADLYAYVRHLKANDLDSRAWEIAFWSRIARLVSAIVVCVFAVPFALGPLRSAGAGGRTVLGIMAGVLFLLLTQTLENSGRVYELNPLLVAWGPTLLLAVIATVAIRRAH